MYSSQTLRLGIHHQSQWKFSSFQVSVNNSLKERICIPSSLQVYFIKENSTCFSKYSSNSKFKCLSSHYFLEEKYRVKPPCRLKILSELFGGKKNIYGLFKKEPRLAYCDAFYLQRNVSTLQSYGVPNKDIRSHLTYLCWTPLTVEHHIQIIRELLIKDPTITEYRNYTRIMKSPIILLKAHGLLAQDYDPFEVLTKMGCPEMSFKHLDLPTSIENITLAELHQELSKTWLCWRLDCDRQKIEQIRKLYPQTIPKSMVLQDQFFNMLQDHFEFCYDKILRNAFLLNGSPSNLSLILQELQWLLQGEDKGVEMSQIAGYNARVLIMPYQFLLYIDRILQQLQISPSSLIKLPGIFTLHPDTVVSRINELQKLNEFKSFKNHPRMIRILYYHKKFQSRIELVKNSDVKNPPSLNILSGTNAQFYKYMILGEMRANKRDLATFLAEYFYKEKSEVMKVLNNKKLPQTTVVDAQENIEFLLEVGFSNELVWESLHIVVYHPELIRKEFGKICERLDAKHPYQVRNTSNVLQLLLYYLNKATFK